MKLTYFPVLQKIPDVGEVEIRLSWNSFPILKNGTQQEPPGSPEPVADSTSSDHSSILVRGDSRSATLKSFL